MMALKKLFTPPPPYGLFIYSQEQIPSFPSEDMLVYII